MTDAETFALDNAWNLWSELRSGAAAVVARTVAAGAAPGVWSTLERAAQRLELEVEEILCGKAPPRLTVELPLVQGSRLAAAEPRLADWLAASGARAIHLVPGGRPLDEELAALPATAANVELVRSLCGAPAAPGPGALAAAVAAVTEAGAFPPVLDVVDGERLVARFVSSGGTLTAYSGVRAQRLGRARDPDVVVTPDELRRALDRTATSLPAAAARALAAAGDELRRRGSLRPR